MLRSVRREGGGEILYNQYNRLYILFIVNVMKDNSFRLIALRVQEGCNDHIKRTLMPEMTYFLCNDYEDEYDCKDNWCSVKKATSAHSVPLSGFFSLPEKNEKSTRFHSPNVNISAIVGKNGDGKSSLIELLLRVINNFGVAYGFQEDQRSLKFVKGVYATLFYELGSELYSITCEDEYVYTSFDIMGRSKSALKQHQEKLFYTIVANYSIYAYNARHLMIEMEEDNDCWINGVFHKNDSYQTPIVLNPMRTDGNFDVNREEDLCRQRLMALYTDLGNDTLARRINDSKVATGYAFNLEEKSKLETSTLKRFFRATWKSTELSPVAKDLQGYVKSNNVSFAFETKEKIVRNLSEQFQFWRRYGPLWKKYYSLFILAERVQKEIYEENGADYSSEETDLQMYLRMMQQVLDSNDFTEEDYQVVLSSINYVSQYCGRITGAQFQRLVLIIDVCELWSKHVWFKKSTFENAINRYVAENNTWNNARCHALLYVIYKTISIFEQYRRFDELIDLKNRYFYLFDGEYEDGTGYESGLSKCFRLLFMDNKQEHIEKKYDTLKLRQTINYLRYKTFPVNGTEDYWTMHLGFGHYVTFDRMFGLIEKAKQKCKEETIALLPPPIFVGDIIIREKEDKIGNPRFRISDLSSGELQMLNSISTYLYHLRNLNYHVGADRLIEYSYVNLILEEVELYFHPEYQRKYIYEMLRQIEQVHLENIKAINIILVTHSPFVLTDIPKNNVLFLREGVPVHIMQENTFGANIHSLLQNGFFLEGSPMGEFAKVKINKMFERLHNGECSDALFDEIKLVSEPLLKTQLYQLFSLNKLPYQNPQYDKLVERVKILESKLNG